MLRRYIIWLIHSLRIFDYITDIFCQVSVYSARPPATADNRHNNERGSHQSGDRIHPQDHVSLRLPEIVRNRIAYHSLACTRWTV